ncbi:MAG: hypothetical protein KKD86_12990 [Bacteroidetes bacterium]|nr:hypothetical protein [Bacteroidota bacterium]MBU1679744.1 hypothetical protein [Bacteroidota bacterium]
MKKLFILLMFSILAFSVSFGQIDKKKIADKAFDSFSEIKGELTLRFFNALDGKPIPDADVMVMNIGEYETDFEGKVLFLLPEEDGIFKIKFQHEKFITSQFEIEIQARTLIFNRFSISPKMPIGTVRVVLDWGKSPNDLDAHLVKEGDYHISFRNMIVSKDGIARLDKDDIDGFGPETITIKSIDKNASYKFYTHDYTNKGSASSTALGNSNASIKVYGGDNELLEVFTVSSSLVGDKWEVFEIVSGMIIK